MTDVYGTEMYSAVLLLWKIDVRFEIDAFITVLCLWFFSLERKLVDCFQCQFKANYNAFHFKKS